MNETTLSAFAEELESIILSKHAGALSYVGGVAKNVGKGLKAFATPITSAKAGWKHTVGDFHKGGIMSKALLVGGTGMGARDAVKKEDPTGAGRSKTRRVLQTVGDTVGGVIAAKAGVSGQIAGSIVGGSVGDRVGKTFDKLRRYKAPPKAPDATPMSQPHAAAHATPEEGK